MAQMTLGGTVKAVLSVTATHVFDMATGTVPLSKTATMIVDSAATSLTTDLIWQNISTIAGGGANVDIDLNDAAAAAGIMEFWGVDDGVRKCQFSRVHSIYIKNTTTDAAAGESILVVGADAAPFPWFFGIPATDTIEIAPGGFILASSGVDTGWPVGAGATDILHIANDDEVNAVTYEIVVIGESIQSAVTTTTAGPTTTTAAATTTTAAATTTT